MTMPRFVKPQDGEDALNPLPFRDAQSTTEQSLGRGEHHEALPGGLSQTADDLFDAFDTMSRRIDDLARELNCLGYFDDEDDDGPRAA